MDEFRLMVFPTVLGKGKRFSAIGADKRRYELVESRPVGPDGVLRPRLKPARSDA